LSTTRRWRCCEPRRSRCAIRQLLRPAISTLERLVASARARAERDTYRLEPVLDAQTRRALDALCVTVANDG
jgi:hypothetical protein